MNSHSETLLLLGARAKGYVRLHRLFVQLNPIFSFAGRVANPATNFTKKNLRDVRPKCKTKDENTTLLIEQKKHCLVFQCWLNCQVASFEALLSLEKTISEPTLSWSRVLFLSFVVQLTISVKIGQCLCLLVSHRTNMLRKKFLVVTERCISGDQLRKGRDAHLQVLDQTQMCSILDQIQAFCVAALG